MLTFSTHLKQCILMLFFSWGIIFINSNADAKQVTIMLASGDTLSKRLTKEKVVINDVYESIASLSPFINPSTLKAGQTITIALSPSPIKSQYYTLDGMIIPLSPAKRVMVSKKDADYYTILYTVPTHQILVKASFTIETTLYAASTKAGIPANILNKMIKLYSYDIDFQRDLRQGNRLDILYEGIFTEDGEWVKSGKLVHATLHLEQKSHRLFYHLRADGKEGYYDYEGKNIVKSLLRTPIDGARISSGFGNRIHPILGYTKMHKGIDFAAPTGTPIYASGSGVIEYLGRKGSFGRYIRIRHNEVYQTVYAHMSRYAKLLRKGSKVKQGQTIGYVGSSGRSTGPHLHYEIHQHGLAIDPKLVQSVADHRLKGMELVVFQYYIKEISHQFSDEPKHLKRIAIKTRSNQKTVF